MGDDCWLAVVVEPARIFSVGIEAARLGLLVYSPQRWVRVRPVGAAEPLLRSTPLFTRHLLLPGSHARAREMNYLGLRPGGYLLEGWSAKQEDIHLLSDLENAGAFRADNCGRLSGLALLASVDERLAQAFAALFPPPAPRIPARAELLAPAPIEAPAWVKPISAAAAKDVIERPSIRLDDRTAAERSAHASRARGVALVNQRLNHRPTKWTHARAAPAG